jgi:ABC-type transport system involved in multi-copper enzyme maturation permease subunit
MKGISAAFWAESLKVRRSKMLWMTVLAALFMAGMIGFLMFIAKNPELASKMGLLGTKSSMMGNADWPSYLGLLIEMISALGLIGFGFVVSWVFGREYSDRTVKDLLALPIPRSFIVVSKFMVVVIWSALLAFILLVFALLAGGMIGLDGWSGDIALHGVYAFAITTLLTLLLCTPVAFIAGYGRGYLPPTGFIILTIILAQFTVALSLGPYFPWAIPGLYSVAAGAGGPQPGAVSYVILVLTSLAGLVATFAWWRYADQY